MALPNATISGTPPPELTNTIVHTGTRTVTCVLAASGNRVLIQVEDHGTEPTAPTRRIVVPHEERGRGLTLVEAVSQSSRATLPDSGISGWRVWATLNTAAE